MNTVLHNKPKAIVVGGSLGGLFAANMLSRNGWNVEIFERTPEALTGRGAGIVTHPELFDALASAGVVVDESIGVHVNTRITLSREGVSLADRDMPQTLTAWGKMYDVLGKAFTGTYRTGAFVTSVDTYRDHATVTLQDGSTHRADLVIAADGFRSSVREQLLPSAGLEYAGYIAWRGLVDESQLSPDTHAAIFDKFAFCLPPREQILGYPVAGEANSTEPGQRRYNFVWYRATREDDELPDLLTDASGKRWPNGIPPGLIRPDVIADMEDAATSLLAPQFAEVVTKTAQPLFQPIFDLTVPRMAFGRIALLGDAAFVARPHCGMGVTKAAGDAMAIVRALSEHSTVETALDAYSTERVQFGHAIVEHARHLGAYMQAQLKSDQDREMAERYRTPEAVMRETAVSRQF
ncbi:MULTISPECIES: FAD binding domain-containing protein [Cupriavidus]|uniref:FAD-dependent monooxygenase n=1 Tax=Cupriavidus basilensis TaxID=68895 RepID=A0A643G4V0_9BURK|nr:MULTISPECIES: FAD binding domain-containing protein [Cupriavidus]KUE88002.1 monooxygenase [Cupriavidus necator]NOV23774.1 FAD-dependent oxidoreductase [Cupriavidus necator]QOT81827.1 FAD-dependent monooxygenase [Cupriavidus basilensis]BDB30318.1 FAD-dependent monooxygenase [Cupriavidus sp. P-10]